MQYGSLSLYLRSQAKQEGQLETNLKWYALCDDLEDRQ